MFRKTICCIITLLLIQVSVIAETKPVKKVTAVYTTWFPYNYETVQGEAMGFENEIFRAVMKTLDIEVEFIKLPWKRCLHMLRYGDADALISMLKARDREEYTLYAEEYISISKTLLFTHVQSLVEFDGDLEKLKPYTIGVTRGFSYGPEFDQATYLNREEVNDQTAILKKVLSKRNELGIGNQLVVVSLARKLGIRDNIRFLKPPVHSRKLYVGFSKSRDLHQLSKAFTDALFRYKQSGNYLRILTRYGISAADMTAD